MMMRNVNLVGFEILGVAFATDSNMPPYMLQAHLFLFPFRR